MFYDFITKYTDIFFFLKKWEKLLHCKSFSHFFDKKYWHNWDINIWNFNETLINDIVSFEQLGPVLQIDARKNNSNWTGSQLQVFYRKIYGFFLQFRQILQNQIRRRWTRHLTAGSALFAYHLSVQLMNELAQFKRIAESKGINGLSLVASWYLTCTIMNVTSVWLYEVWSFVATSYCSYARPAQCFRYWSLYGYTLRCRRCVAGWPMKSREKLIFV